MISQIPAEVREVRQELGRILASGAFRDRETLQHLLEYLVDDDGTADNLKEYVIGVDVFGTPEGYDPQSDASVRVQIGKLRRKLEEYYLHEGCRGHSAPAASQASLRRFIRAKDYNRTGFRPRAASETRSLPAPLAARGGHAIAGRVVAVSSAASLQPDPADAR